MKDILDKTPTVAETEARLASRSGDPTTGSPSRRPPHEAASHALPPPTGPSIIGLSTHEAARVAGICRSLLYREIAAGRLIARKQGRRTIILDADLRAWLESLPRMPTKPAGEEAAVADVACAVKAIDEREAAP
jgi:excisionase family DNA binding protein